MENGTDGLVRIRSMLDWTPTDIEANIAAPTIARPRLHEHRLQAVHPAALLGGNLRSGRWQGTGETEYDIHTRLRNPRKDNDR